jgi:hypothetical protein
MSIFGDIMSAIFGRSASAAPSTSAPSSSAPSSPAKPTASPSQSGTTTREGPAPEGPKVEWSAPVDVAAVLDGLAKQNKQKLNWRTSIVDLMKLLDLDSGLGARKELAQELGYKGALDGSAEMNVWLHKQVMAKLAEGGGKVPASLKD